MSRAVSALPPVDRRRCGSSIVLRESRTGTHDGDPAVVAAGPAQPEQDAARHGDRAAPHIALDTLPSDLVKQPQMTPERPDYLPELRNPWPRTDYLPVAEPVVDALVARPFVEPLPATEAAQPQDASQPETAPSAERQRVTLAGRLGQAPTIRTTPKGTLVARFPLDVKDEADLAKTTWHTILAFQKRAEQARDHLKKGDPVEVIGYRHHREIPGRDGPRTIDEIYATVIKLR